MARTLVLIALILAFAPGSVNADVPLTTSFQAVLDSSDGTLLSGAHDLTFRIYAVPVGGSPIWVEGHTGVNAIDIQSGVLSVTLGSLNPLDTLAFDQPYYLGIEVGTGGELTPRTELTASAYTLNARTVTDGAITAGKIASGVTVRSINSLTGHVTIIAGSNISVSEMGDTLQIASAGGGGLSLPFNDTVSVTGAPFTAFSVTNSGTGSAATFAVTDSLLGSSAIEVVNRGAGPALDIDNIGPFAGIGVRINHTGVSQALSVYGPQVAGLFTGNTALQAVGRVDIDYTGSGAGLSATTIGGGPAAHFAQGGVRIGAGSGSLTEPLEVDGAIKIGGAASNLAGTIQWTGTELQLSDGLTWINLSDQATSGWTVNGNDLYSDVSGNVGIGTPTPTSKLDVSGEITGASLDLSGAARLGSATDTLGGTIEYSGTDFRGFNGVEWRSLTSGLALPLADTASVGSGAALSIVNTGNGGTAFFQGSSTGSKQSESSRESGAVAEATVEVVSTGDGPGIVVNAITGSGQAISAISQSTAATLSAGHFGTAGYAGKFEIAHFTGANSSPALYAATNGDGPALEATTSGSGPAAHFDGKVGVGVSNPFVKLQVEGALKLSDTESPFGTGFAAGAGTIRWDPTGSDFEGYDGNDWKSLTGSLSLPYSGTANTGTSGLNIENTGPGNVGRFVSNYSNTDNPLASAVFGYVQSGAATAISGWTDGPGVAADFFSQDILSTNPALRVTSIAGHAAEITGDVDMTGLLEVSGDIGLLHTNATKTLEIQPQEGSGGAQILMRNASGTETVQIDADAGTNDGVLILSRGDGTNTIVLDSDINGNSEIKTDILEITGGSDLAEPFPITGHELLPGTVVVIDPNTPGNLKMSRRPYDRTVAGIVSGAGGVRPGLTLRQEGMFDEGQRVALTGRVYALADASQGAIQPGDLLTTATIPGHCMKVNDPGRSQGAILGKAMSSLENGRGLVLVLVNLQ